MDAGTLRNNLLLLIQAQVDPLTGEPSLAVSNNYSFTTSSPKPMPPVTFRKIMERMFGSTKANYIPCNYFYFKKVEKYFFGKELQATADKISKVCRWANMG